MSLEMGLFNSTHGSTVTVAVNDALERVTWVVSPGDNALAESVLVSKHIVATGQDTSVRLKLTAHGVVRRVRVQSFATSRAHRVTVYTIRVSRAHRAQVADKFSSRHGQKGTVGRIMDVWDLPFSERTGAPADVYVNPHCIPTRMTGATLEELGALKAALLAGDRFVDATPFCAHPSWSAKLERAGYLPSGMEWFRSGTTGLRLEEGQLYVGVQQMHVLCHFASKSQARDLGPRDAITRQPVHGKDKMGGLRFGLMEYAAVEARGASAVVRDRNVEVADKALVAVCPVCHRFTWQHDRAHAGTCMWCARTPTASQVETRPTSVITKHTLLLLTQELWAMGISLGASC